MDTRHLAPIVIGLAVLWLGYADYQTQEDRLENAIEIEGTVLENDIDRRSSSNSGSNYYPIVEFEYTHGGETYTSTNIDAADSRTSESTRSGAQSVLEDYPEGETVTAYLDPDEPGEAFLEADRSWGPYLFMGLGAVFVAVGLKPLAKSMIAKRGQGGT